MDITNYRLKELKKDKIFEVLNSNNIKKMKQLLKSDYDINKDLVDGITPLMLATFHTSGEFVELLINYGANMNLLDIYNNNLLMYASLNGSKVLAELIISKSNIPIDSQNLYGWTALMFAIKFNNYDFTKVLLEHNANPNTNLLDGTSALKFSIEKNKKDNKLSYLLIDFGARL